MWIEFGEIENKLVGSRLPHCRPIALPATNQSKSCIYWNIWTLAFWLVPHNQIMSVESEDASVSLFYSLACRVFESQYFKGQF